MKSVEGGQYRGSLDWCTFSNLCLHYLHAIEFVLDCSGETGKGIILEEACSFLYDIHMFVPVLPFLG